MVNLDKVNTMMKELNRRYLQNAISTDNPLIKEAVVGYIAGIRNVNTETRTSLQNDLDLFEFNIIF